MAKKNLSKLFKGATQAGVDAGTTAWNPSMVNLGDPEKSILPPMGAGIRPEMMPEWAKDKLDPLRSIYGGEKAGSADLSNALRSSSAGAGGGGEGAGAPMGLVAKLLASKSKAR